MAAPACAGIAGHEACLLLRLLPPSRDSAHPCRAASPHAPPALRCPPACAGLEVLQASTPQSSVANPGVPPAPNTLAALEAAQASESTRAPRSASAAASQAQPGFQSMAPSAALPGLRFTGPSAALSASNSALAQARTAASTPQLSQPFATSRGVPTPPALSGQAFAPAAQQYTYPAANPLLAGPPAAGFPRQVGQVASPSKHVHVLHDVSMACTLKAENECNGTNSQSC